MGPRGCTFGNDGKMCALPAGHTGPHKHAEDLAVAAATESLQFVHKTADALAKYMGEQLKTPTNIALMGLLELAIRIVRAEQQCDAPKAITFLRGVLQQIADAERAAAAGPS